MEEETELREEETEEEMDDEETEGSIGTLP